MNKILIATSNKEKFKEISAAVKKLTDNKMKILSLSDVNTLGKPIENASTFEENAKIKAKFYGDQVSLPTLADDAGLEIDVLNGDPGVKTRRWKGYEAEDKELIEYTLIKLKGIPLEKRTAKLTTCVCIYFPEEKKFYTSQASIKGKIAIKPLNQETNGYPFRVLFIVDELDKFYGEMSEKEHNKVNHRLKAINSLKQTLNSKLVVK